MPAANYGLAAGIHELNSISDRSGTTHARGINDYGFIVGTYGGNKVLEGEAIVWNMNETDGNGKYVTTLLDTNDEFEWSGAFGLSNHATNPLIVGHGGFEGECDCGDEGIVQPLQRIAFAVRLNSVPIDSGDTLETTEQNSVAWDVTEEDETVAGRFHCKTDHCMLGSECDVVPNAVAWIEGDATTLTQFMTGLGESRGTNALAELVGSSYETGFSTCRQRAIYWPDSAANKVVLGHRVPNGSSTETTVALAINVPTSGPTQVVGYSPTNSTLAPLWQREGCTEPCTDEEEWVAYNLASSNITFGVGSAGWSIHQAHNITNDGTIVAFARTPAEDRYVVKLTVGPVEGCLADINNYTGTHQPDGQVSVHDLFDLLSQWGDCVNGVVCSADVTSGVFEQPDGKVDVFDLFYLLGHWDTCEAPEDIELDEDYCYEKYPGGGQELYDCLEAVAIANGYIEEE